MPVQVPVPVLVVVVALLRSSFAQLPPCPYDYNDLFAASLLFYEVCRGGRVDVERARNTGVVWLTFSLRSVRTRRRCAAPRRVTFA
jgi:hypothetical protein